jgi:hypothetical protein
MEEQFRQLDHEAKVHRLHLEELCREFGPGKHFLQLSLN